MALRATLDSDLPRRDHRRTRPESRSPASLICRACTSDVVRHTCRVNRLNRRAAKRSSKDRVIFWGVLVTGYFASTLGLFPLIGIHISLVHVVLSGLSMLAGWSLAHWMTRRFFGLGPRR